MDEGNVSMYKIFRLYEAALEWAFRNKSGFMCDEDGRVCLLGEYLRTVDGDRVLYGDYTCGEGCYEMGYFAVRTVEA